MIARAIRFGIPLVVVLASFHLLQATATSVEDVRAALRQTLERAGKTIKLDGRTADAASLKEFYARRDFEPIWIGPDGPTERAKAVLAKLSEAAREGLDPADYALSDRMRHPTSTAELAESEIALSDALIRYAADVSTGRLNPKKIDPQFYVFKREIDRAGVLEGAADTADLAAYVDDLAPANSIYRGLRRALAHYRRLAAEGGWGTLPEGPTLKAGMRSDRVALLRRILKDTGDLTIDSADPAFFDQGLEFAVKDFQRRHGLEPDGAVGPKTRAALNVPVQLRIGQIILNMERWRWMPEDLGDVYVLVNMAGFEADLVEHGSISLSMRVVIGKPYLQTPAFSGLIRYLEFNPYWNVPRSIAVKEILPKLKKDPSYLAQHQMRVLSVGGKTEIDPETIDWSQLNRNYFPYRLRQDPGPKNALGRIKFMFPNRFSVYMHDTPSRNLFRKTVRTFSHGCIRVEKPLAFAEHLLKANKGWTMEKIRSVIASGKNTTVSLARPVPVYITYLTAWSGEGGTINFRNDVYGRDQLLDRALFQKAR